METIDGKRLIEFYYKGESFFDNSFFLTITDYTLDTDYTFKIFKEGSEVLSLSVGDGIVLDENTTTITVSYSADALSPGEYTHELKSVNTGVDVKLIGRGKTILC